LGQRELLVLGYLGSADPADHPSRAELGTNLGIQGKRTQKILDDLHARRILFRDFVAYGRRDKSLWHLSHPGWWQGCSGFTPDASTTDPASYQSLQFMRDRDRKRINQLRSFILAQDDTVRVPNLLFRMPVSWRAKYLYIRLLFLGENIQPTVDELAALVGWDWRTVRSAMNELSDHQMIAIQTADTRVFTGWKRHYLHLTDCYDWRHDQAKMQFSAPKVSRVRSLDLSPSEPRWRAIKKQMFTPHRADAGSYTVSFQFDGQHYSAPFFCDNGNYETAFGNCEAAKGNCEAAELSLMNPVQAPARKGSGTYKKAYQDSPQECIRVRACVDDSNAGISKARAISIAEGARDVWVWESFKCDRALWTDEVQTFANTYGEADARRLVAYANEVLLARGRRRLAYNVTSIGMLIAGFLDQIPASEFGKDRAAYAANPALECEVLAHTSHSSATAFITAADGTLPLPSTGMESAEPGPVSAAMEAQPESVDLPVAPDRDPLANLPADEDRLRWVVGRMLPKLGKSQKADLRDLWQKHGPRGAVLRFAGKSDENCLAVMGASNELSKVGILRSADIPRLPWENPKPAEGDSQTMATDCAPAQENSAASSTDSHSTLLSDFRACQERRLAGEKASEGTPITRARLNNAFAVLARDMKFSARTRMLMELGKLNDADLWSRLAETFTEPMLLEVLRDIP
jgi:hypothetical protein